MEGPVVGIRVSMLLSSQASGGIASKPMSLGPRGHYNRKEMVDDGGTSWSKNSTNHLTAERLAFYSATFPDLRDRSFLSWLLCPWLRIVSRIWIARHTFRILQMLDSRRSEHCFFPPRAELFKSAPKSIS